MFERLLKKLLLHRLKSWGLERKSKFLTSVVHEVSGDLKPKEALQFLFGVENRLYKSQGKAAKRYEKGKHPKHRLTQYHDFFIQNIGPKDRVLDIGSGWGYLAYDIVKHYPEVQVHGIELEADRVALAKENFSHPHLHFSCGNAMEDLPQQQFEVITLSNILEHIEDRNLFLNLILERTQAKKILIRVPQKDRDWRVPLKDEVGVDSRLSQGHFVEYTKDIFKQELIAAGLAITSMQFNWGEIWAIAEPLPKTQEAKV